MMRIISLMICTGLAALCCNVEAVDDLEALTQSPVWQVRYCVSTKLDAPSAETRRLLERLSVDEVPAVARQAFANYSGKFVVLKRDIVNQAFARGDFDLDGFNLDDRKAFENPDFWVFQLSESNDPSMQARAVRAIGMCGTAANVAKLTEYLGTTNSYLLIELAFAFYRLGDVQRYLEVIDALLALPINEALYYQTYAIDCLIQTHPERARPDWQRVHEQFDEFEGIQPGWVYSHIVQEARLPR